MKQTILIAEDEADIRKLLRLYLESEGFGVIEAENGEEAISAAHTCKPDMAILDIMMPKSDGFAVTQALRKDSDIPILIVSARSQDYETLLRSPDVEGMLNSPAFMEGRYEDVNAVKYLGTSGGFSIIKEDGRTLYSSTSSIPVIRSRDTLLCIPEYNADTYLESISLRTADGEQRLIITQETYSDNELIRTTAVMLDHNGHVLEGELHPGKKSYTQEEICYLTGTWSDEFSLTRHSTEDKNGSVLTVLLLIPYYSETYFQNATAAAGRIWLLVIPVYLLKMCVQNLLRRKSRTLLTMLGVLIGCCSIVIMVSIGLGTAESQKMMLEQMGDLTIINVTPKQNGQNRQKLDDAAVSNMKSLPHVIAATPKVTLDDYGCTAKLYAGVNDRYVASWGTVAAIDTKALEKMGYKLLSGNNTTQSGEVLAGEFLAYNLTDSFRPEGNNTVDRWSGEMDENGNPLNPPDPYFDASSATMTIEVEADGKKSRFPVKSTGVLKEDQVKGYETSEGLIMNISDIQKILSAVGTGNQKKPEYKTVLIKVSDITKVAEVEKAVRKLGFTTSSMESIREPMEKEARQKQLMLGGLGAISLFVAALGITNTMIMSISEHTREIGIMKSLGCSVIDIRLLFLAEAGAIGLLGGIGGENITRVCVVPPWLLPAAVAFSIVIGLGSGYYPANKAVQISALEAIKSN